MAGNQEAAVKAAYRATGSKESREVLAAYDAYCQSMRRAKQNPKSLGDLCR